VSKGTKVSINVLASGTVYCSSGAVSASVGTVTSGGSSGCFSTAFLDTSSLNPGTYDVTLSFAGDSTHFPSQSTAELTVT
jgi:hypothetical protein